MTTLKYKRVLLKLSGEALGAAGGIKPQSLNLVVTEISRLRKMGVQVSVVVGAGNIWRKRTHGQGIDSATADYLGLLATVMNGLALHNALARKNIASTLQSPVAYDLPGIKSVDYTKAQELLNKKQVVIYAGGTGKPFFTTDTAAAQRAAGVKAQLIIKAGPVDGVYTADPRKFYGARKYKSLTVGEALAKKIKVMDRQAFVLCKKNHIPIIVCRWQKGVLSKIVKGEAVGTEISV